MPVYEYQCKACKKEFEYQQRMSDPDLTVCEACGESALEKLISRTAFTLKGGGWYKDLYSSTKPESKSSDAGGGDAKPAASGDSSSSTPAAATPAKSSDSGSSSSGGSSSGGSSSGGSSSGGSSGGGGSTSKAAAAAR